MAHFKTRKKAEEAAKNAAWVSMGEGCSITRSDYKECIVLSIVPVGTAIVELRRFSFGKNPKVEKDTPVWVWSNLHTKWFPRYATGNFSEEGYIACYADGGDSFTSDPSYVRHWDKYTLIEPKK